VRRPEKQPQRGRGRRGAGGAAQQATSRRAARRSGKALPLACAVEAVREDGFFRHQEIAHAHADAVSAVIMAEDAIYTASRDKLLKRWKAQKTAENRFELHADLEVPLGAACWCLLSAGEWLLCGLADGAIRAYSKSGREATLAGHTKRVNCLLLHESVLLSGAGDGFVRCWQMNPQSQTFECTHSITEGISNGVTCMSVLNEHLWVGGTSGVSLVELASLKVTLQLAPKKFVAGLLQFQGHMIVAYADGSVRIFDAAGGEKLAQPPLKAGPVLSVVGLERGPRVLCGHAKGQVSSITLPMFQFKTCWQALERCKVQSLCCAGHDGIFIVGGENGSLQLWQRDDLDEL